MTSATVTYTIDTTAISQELSVAEFVLVLIITIINFAMIWTHYARSYNTFCAQYVTADDERNEVNITEIAMAQQQKKEQDTSKLEENEEKSGVSEYDEKKQQVLDKNAKFYKDSSTLTILTCGSLTCYFLAALYTLIIEAATKEATFCVNFVIPIIWSYTIGRTLQFTVYLARLEFLYNGEQCAYKRSTLMILATITSVIAVVILSLQAAYIDEVTLLINNDKFPFFCEFLLKDFVLVIMLVYDVVLSIGSITLFWIPLSKIVKEKSSKVAAKLLKKFGIKYAVIVTITSAWSVINYLLLISLDLTLLAPTLTTINSITLILLSPYYTKTLGGCYGSLGLATISDIQQAIKKEE